MTPEQIAQAAEEVLYTPWYIAAEAAWGFGDSEIGTQIGFIWNCLQQDNEHALLMAQRGLLDLNWQLNTFDLNRTEIATVILEKVFGDND